MPREGGPIAGARLVHQAAAGGPLVLVSGPVLEYDGFNVLARLVGAIEALARRVDVLAYRGETPVSGLWPEGD